jgi:glycosyltransferase involved in cell wall biosynthesis
MLLKVSCNLRRIRQKEPMNAHPPTPLSLSVVMPVFNEDATIISITERVLRLSCVVELIVIDDCSTDGTWNELQKIAANPKVKLLRHPINRGKSAALRSGFAGASAPIVVIQDADLEYDPDDLPLMMRALEDNHADVVYGSRFSKAANSTTRWWHRWENRALTWASNYSTGTRLTDEATCYKMFKREILSRITLEEDGFGFCPEFTAKISRLGVPILEVPIRYRARSRAEGKKIRFTDGLAALRCLVQYGLFPRIFRQSKTSLSRQARIQRDH